MINKSRIRNVAKYLTGIQDDSSFFVCVKVNDIGLAKLKLLGFSDDPVNGEQVLPRILGSVSRFNADSKFIKLKDLPMETKYRGVSVKDWHGDYHFVDVSYKRYQREEIPAPSIELRVVNESGVLYVVAPLQHKNESNESRIKHVINLFLELFGYCEILDEAFNSTINSIPIRKVNWQILPGGEYPWERIAQLAGNISNFRPGKAECQKYKISTILKYNPSEIVFGKGGFRGYLVFKFPDKNLFVMENAMYGNATYVFEESWEYCSQLTKAEILQNNLEMRRLEHRFGWHTEIDELLS